MILKRFKPFILSALLGTILSENSFSQTSSVENYVYTHLAEGNVNLVVNFLKNLESLQNAEGIHYLGLLYLNGWTGTQHAGLANYYFSCAAALNYPPALKALADSYMAGDGLEKNENTAFTLYERAALLGYGPAQFNTGIMLKKGQGVTSNPKRAYHFLNLAAHNPDLGDLQADAAHYRDEIKNKG